MEEPPTLESGRVSVILTPEEVQRREALKRNVEVLGDAYKAHKVLVRLKNRRREAKLRAAEEEAATTQELKTKYPLWRAVLVMVGIVLHWAILVTVASLHLRRGDWWEAGFFLFFQFVGGAVVTFNLSYLMRRRGDDDFENELRKGSRVLIFLMNIPTFLPFFSAGLKVNLISRLRKATDAAEIRRLAKLIDICEERLVTEKLYDSAFSSFPLGVSHLTILLELPGFHEVEDYVLVLAFVSVLRETTMAPIDLARVFNGLNPLRRERVAGLANKAVTFLSFAMWIAAARRYFAEPEEAVDLNLIITTLVASVISLLLADVPGIYSYHLELKEMQKRRKKNGWEFLMDLITMLVPIGGITFWIVTLSLEGDLIREIFLVPTIWFAVLFAMTIVGLCRDDKLPWLGQFSSDILILFYIAFISFFRKHEFHDIDFRFEPKNNTTKAESVP